MENEDRRYIGEPRNDPGEAAETGRMERMRERTRDTLDKAKEGLAAGAATATEVGRNAVTGARDRASRAAEFVRDAEADVELERTVTRRTENSLERAGEALTRAAPTIGRGTERVAEKLGQALQAVSHPTGVALGSIAGTVGGWWRKAADEGQDMPESEDEVCRAHFMRIAAPPPGMTYDRARPAYAVGYLASRNPGYRGRPFDELELELREGFREDGTGSYDSVRDFARFGYERGSSSEI